MLGTTQFGKGVSSRPGVIHGHSAGTVWRSQPGQASIRSSFEAILDCMTTAPGGGDNPSCIVIGAGVIGLGIAWELARVGWTVSVLERGPVSGRGTSAAAAGMLAAGVEASAPGPFLDLCRRSAALWDDWAAGIQDDSGVDCELERTGLLRVTSQPQMATAFEVRRAWQINQGMRVSELLSFDDLRREVRGISSTMVAGLMYPDEAHVHAHRVLEGLEGAGRGRGVQIETQVEIERVELTSDGVAAVARDGRSHLGDRLVVAAGPWSGRLLAELGVAAAVEPVRGQICAVRMPGGSLPRIVFGDGGYVLQKRSGVTLVGATEEQVGFEPWATLGAMGELAQVAQGLYPAAATAPLVHLWAGLRPHAPGGPLLGRVPKSDRILLATGHHRNGILLAPVTAALIKEALVSGVDPAELSPFSPARCG